MYNYQEVLNKYGTRHGVKRALEEGAIVSIGRNRYCDAEEAMEDHSFQELARHREAAITGHAAYYILGLTDLEPDGIDFASKRGGTKMSEKGLRQHFIPAEWLDVGKTSVSYAGMTLPCYDKERMLLELMRNRNKMPYDLYKEIVRAYRKSAEEIDMRKLQAYARKIPRGESYLRRILSEVF